MEKNITDLFISARQTLERSGFRKEFIRSKEYMIVPTTAIVAGVLKEFYFSKEILKKYFKAYNGVPVTVGHPVSRLGKFVSANGIESEKTIVIGKVFNTNFEKDKITCEVWIDIERAEMLGYRDILTHFSNGNSMEVSIGAIITAVYKKGIFNGKNFKYQIVELQADHLGLLPDDIGACNKKDGCGANIQGGANMNKDSVLDTTEGNDGAAVDSDIDSSTVLDKENKLFSAMKIIGEKLGINIQNNRRYNMPIDNKTPEPAEANKQPDADQNNVKQVQAYCTDKADPVSTGEANVAVQDQYSFSATEYEALMSLKNKEDKRIETLRKEVMSFNNKLTDGMVKSWDVDTLELMHKEFKPAVNSGAMGSFSNKKADTVPEMPSIVLRNYNKDDNKDE